jgi:hypothetical protein
MLIRVVDILGSVALDSKKWEDANAAVRVQAQVADLIWEADAESARYYLLQAWETASAMKDEKRNRQSTRNTSPQTEARQEALRTARKRDPELAKKWLAQMAEEEQARQDGQKRGVFDDRTQRSTLLLQMAMTAIAEDPQAAAAMAIESLQDGISFGLQNVMLGLLERDFELAQTVFRAALSRLRVAGLLDPGELLILYSYLYTPGRVAGVNTTANRGSFPLSIARNQPRVVAAAELNAPLSQEFLKLAAELLVNAPLPSTTSDPQGAARSQITAISFLVGKVSQHWPEQAEALRIRAQLIQSAAQFSPTPVSPRSNTPAPNAGETQQEYSERRVDMLEAAARKEYSPLKRDITYAEAALATLVGNYKRGWSLADNIQDETLRSSIKNLLTYRAALHLLKSEKVDEAYEVNAKNNDPAQRAVCLVVGAQKLLKAKDHNRSREWLLETGVLIKKSEPDENWTRIAMGVVSTYAKFDNLVALQSLSHAVKLMEKFPISTTDERAPLVKRFSGPTVSDFTYGTTGFGLISAVGAFDSEEFENVYDTLNTITRPEIRGVAIVTLCRKRLESGGVRPK